MSRSFADVLRDLSGGATYEKLSLDLADVVQAVNETQKGGTITLTLAIAANGPGSVTIAESVKTKVPEPAKGKTLFYATTTGHLSRNDPRQTEMKLREVEGDKSPLREVG